MDAPTPNGLTATAAREPRAESPAARAKNRNPLLFLFAATAAFWLAGAAAAAAPSVVATVGMIGDVAAELAGDCAQVTTLMGPGSDPHLYRASAGDVRALNGADLVLYGGLHLEAGLADVLAAFAARRPVVAVSELAVPEEERLAAGVAGMGVYDPHVWMDVSQWARAVPVVAEALAGVVDDGCRGEVAARAQDYQAQLGALHEWARAALASVPRERRVLVTAHDAFAYFGRAYDVEVLGIQGVSTETEAAVADIRRVAELVVARGVPTVFVESTINPRTVEAVREAVAARGGSVGLGASLYADALGDAKSPDGTYVGMVVHNVRAIVAGLGGEVPPLPGALAPWEARW